LFDIFFSQWEFWHLHFIPASMSLRTPILHIPLIPLIHMKLDRRNVNRVSQRDAHAPDRPSAVQPDSAAITAIDATTQDDADSGLVSVVEDAIISRERSASLRESTLQSRSESMKLRESVVVLRERYINEREDLISEAEREILTEENAATTRENNLASDLSSPDSHQQHNRMLVEANEQLVIASLQLQAAAEKIEKNKEELAHLAYHDSLTQLPNRMQLYDRITQAIAFAKRRTTTLAVLFLDLDRFKTINDTLGHAVGDQLLQAVAQRLKSAVRDTDTVSRHGGDEFILMLTEVSPGEGLNLKIGEIHRAITASYQIADATLEIGATIGISLFPADGEDADTLIRNADAAMYDAKKNGRNKYQYYLSTMQDCNVDCRDSVAELRLAVARSEFTLCYQAQIDLQSGAVSGVEALIRWRHPLKGLLLPGDFIPLAEESGVIIAIGQWVLKEACRQAKDWLANDVGFHVMAVNISAKEFEDIDFLENVRSILLETGLMPHHLELELTESALMKSMEETAAILHSLKSMGVRISIDDFGTGYSSLSYLKDFPVDAIKIDQSFIHDISPDAENVLVHAIISLGRNLHHQVIAEGVETQLQLDFLRQHRCATAQGFYLNMPMLAEDCAAFLKGAKSPLH
jgi:diguanylate cyclase